MNKTILVSAMGLLAGWSTFASAEEVGRVITSTPVTQQVAVPRQVCSNQPVAMQQPNTGAGAVMGGIAGGAMGNAIGGGSGRAAATVIGLIGGAIVGNNIEGSGSYVQNVQQCGTQTFYENRTVAYNVVYEYAGKEFSVQMPYDPGPTIRLQLTPMASTEPAPAPTVAAESGSSGTPIGVIVGTPGQTVIQSSTTVYPAYAPAYPVAYPAYPAYYYPRPYYYAPIAPIGFSLNLGYSRGWHHRR